MRFTSTTALLLGLSVAVSAAPLLSHEVETPTTTTTTASIDARSSHHHTSEPQPTSGIDIDDVPDSYYYRHDDDGEDSLEERALNLDKTWGSSLKWYPTKEPTWQKGQWQHNMNTSLIKDPGSEDRMRALRRTLPLPLPLPPPTRIALSTREMPASEMPGPGP